ncbi:uncharacterized protein ARMOST_06330 [Armillaria ostoyae]|uniref:Uncharacterized protein n=1 Tax=Armillaria ostoyae TaxID=47428 RepID=A0A284R2Q6_ARMOS|nr:uncharacterized protein ARMOST_06330 [Armillaria ostoyae]
MLAADQHAEYNFTFVPIKPGATYGFPLAKPPMSVRLKLSLEEKQELKVCADHYIVDLYAYDS